MVDRDPLEILRAAWVEVEPPPADRDAATDALVDDLRAAWRGIETPSPDPRHFHAALRERRRAKKWCDRAILAAAASLLFALIITARRAPSRADRASEEVAAHNAISPDDAVRDETLRDDHPRVADDSRIRRLDPAIRARALENGDIELRHGRVRLLLGGRTNTIIETPEPTAQSAANDEEESQ